MRAVGGAAVAIAAGSLVAGCSGGRKVSAFPPLAPDIEAAGGECVEGPDVVDGNMVSATGWPDLAEWSRAFMQVLERTAVPA